MEKNPNWVKKAIIFLGSQTVSLFGSSIVGYAIVWYITLETSSATLMTISILCTFVPQVLISLFGGVWADRYNRKLLIMGADLFIALSTLILAIVFLSGNHSLTLLFTVSAIRSLGAGVQMPAVNAVLPQIVPMDKLTRVNGINVALNNILLLISPAVGGMLLGSVGFAYALLVDVITALLAVGIMCFLKIQHTPRVHAGSTAIAELREGLSYTLKHDLLRNLLVFYAIFYFLVSPAAFLSPIMVERTFGAEVWRLTANEMVWTAGSLLGGVIISLWGGFRSRIVTMAFSAAGFGITFALLGVAPNFITYLIIMMISGMFMPLFSTAETVLIQENVEEAMLGRVFSIVQIIVSSAMPLGMILFGPLGDMIPIEYVMIGSGLCMVVLAPTILKCNKLVR